MPLRELAGKPSEARARMWRAMRMCQGEGFSVRELIAMAQVRRKAVEKFLHPLLAAGYLRAERGGPARRYWLIKNTGPIPPRVQKESPAKAGATLAVLDINVEITRLRVSHGQLLEAIRAVENKIARYGAYIEKYSPEYQP